MKNNHVVRALHASNADEHKNSRKTINTNISHVRLRGFFTISFIHPLIKKSMNIRSAFQGLASLDEVSYSVAAFRDS